MGTARIHYLLLCDSVSFADGKFTYHGVFDRIQATQFPCVHRSLSLAVQLSCEPGTHKLRVRVVDSDERDAIPDLPAVDLRTDHPLGLATTSLTIQGLPLARPGIYTFRLFLDEEIIGARDFFVEKAA